MEPRAFASRRALWVLGCAALSTLAAPAYAALIFDPPIQYSVAAGPYELSLVDVDGDGKLDAIGSCYDGNRISVSMGNGTGFAPPALYRSGWTGSHSVGDLDKDGRPDIVVCQSQEDSVFILHNDGGGVFSFGQQWASFDGPRSAAIADFDNDTWPDIVVVESWTYEARLYRNVSGTFVPWTVLGGVGTTILSKHVLAVDLDNDGLQDILVCNAGSVIVTWFRQTSPGTWSTTQLAMDNSVSKVVAVDLDQDGDLDLAAATENRTAAVRLNQGGGTFSSPVTYAVQDLSQSIAAADFDRDGKIDLAVSNFSQSNVSVLRGAGGGFFHPAVNFGTTYTPRDVEAADLDGDLKPELLTIDYRAGSGGISVLLNHSSEPGTEPQILSFSPPGGAPGANVTLTGHRFTGATAVRFNGVNAAFSVPSDSVVFTTVPAAGLTGSISLTTPNGTAISPGIFTVAPRISTFNPTQGIAGTVITVAGDNFGGVTAAAVGGVGATFEFISPVQLRITVPNNAVTGPLSATNSGGTGTSSSPFTVTPPPPPPITFSPTAGAPGTVVTIIGSGSGNLGQASSVRFGGYAASYTIVDNSRIDAIVPNQAETGKVSVTTPSGSVQSNDDFIVRPLINSFYPETGPPGAAITVVGINFLYATQTSVGGSNANFLVLSNSAIRITVPNGAVTGPISVTNPGGSATSSTDFTVTVGPPGTAGMNLSWFECGALGNEFASFACNTNGGTPFTMVGSFMPPPGLSEYLGMQADLTVRSDAATLPDWWKFGTSECRGATALSSSFDFTTGPTGCADFYHGQAAGGHAYDIGFGGPDRARLRLSCAVPIDNRGPLTTGTEYYAFKASIARSKTLGSPSCAGCDARVTITLNSIQLFQPPASGFDPVIDDPLYRATIEWQNTPPPPPLGPVISSFSPPSGGEGTLVTVFGRRFTGATSVRFGSLSAAFSVVSDSVVNTAAPTGVTTSFISITTPEGTADSPNMFQVGGGPSGPSGINLSWSECGTAGAQNQAFACDGSSGSPLTLVSSFMPPANINQFLGVSGEMMLKTADATLPDWWKFGNGQCRGATLVGSADFTSGFSACADFYQGQAAGGIAYDIGFGSPRQARLRFQCAIPLDNRGAVSPGTEYYAFRVTIPRTVTGTGTCTGCESPMCIVLNSIQLFQPPEALNDPILFNPLDRNFVSWQSAPFDCPASTAAQASLISADAEVDRVRLAWNVEIADAIAIERRTKDAAWAEIARAVPDGSHRVRYEDRDVVAGATYSYRLRIAVNGGHVFAGEADVTVPFASELALGAVTWDGSGRRIAVSLSIARGAAATLELYDLSGRRVARRSLDGLAPGTHDTDLTVPNALRSGVYFLRLQQGDRKATRGVRVVM